MNAKTLFASPSERYETFARVVRRLVESRNGRGEPCWARLAPDEDAALREFARGVIGIHYHEPSAENGDVFARIALAFTRDNISFATRYYEDGAPVEVVIVHKFPIDPPGRVFDSPEEAVEFRHADRLRKIEDRLMEIRHAIDAMEEERVDLINERRGIEDSIRLKADLAKTIALQRAQGAT